MDSNTAYSMMILIIMIIIILIILCLTWVIKSPFCYPYFVRSFDVSGKRKPDMDVLIDEFLNQRNFQMIQKHNEYIQLWKQECNEKINGCKLLKNYRRKQYENCIDDRNAFVFVLTREQTRYKQKNYVKTPYKVTQTIEKIKYDYEYLEERNRQLAQINYECALRDYHKKDQRRLMTKELRKRIMIRDHYTCQVCGKYMPDEVGLQIDHIVPISKGGKTVPSNLQVLCSKCNGNKSNKV